MSKSEIITNKNWRKCKKEALEEKKEELRQFGQVRLEIKRRWGVLDHLKQSGRTVTNDIEMECLFE